MREKYKKASFIDWHKFDMFEELLEDVKWRKNICKTKCSTNCQILFLQLSNSLTRRKLRYLFDPESLQSPGILNLSRCVPE